MVCVRGHNDRELCGNSSGVAAIVADDVDVIKETLIVIFPVVLGLVVVLVCCVRLVPKSMRCRKVRVFGGKSMCLGGSPCTARKSLHCREVRALQGSQCIAGKSMCCKEVNVLQGSQCVAGKSMCCRDI